MKKIVLLVLVSLLCLSAPAQMFNLMMAQQGGKKVASPPDAPTIYQSYSGITYLGCGVGNPCGWGIDPTTCMSIRYDVSTSSDFSSFVHNNVLASFDWSGADFMFYAIGLTENTTYYVRIRATNANGTSANSNTYSYTTPYAPPVIYRNGNYLYWAAVPGATDYHVYGWGNNYADSFAVDTSGSLDYWIEFEFTDIVAVLYCYRNGVWESGNTTTCN